MPPFEEYIETIKPLWESARVTNCGAIHEELERLAARYLKVGGLSLFANGHLALSAAISTLGLTGEVITTPFTFASTTHAIVENGLEPVFCDINPDDCTMDASKIETLITDKTSAILPVHVYGNACDTDEIERIAKKHQLKVIYDAAHAFGVELNGRGIGSYGDAAMFSFHATKVFHSVEGGAVASSETELKKCLESKRNFGLTSPDNVETIGFNAKMSEFHAAMGLVNLRHLDEQILLRKKICERYAERLTKIPGIKLPKTRQGVKRNYAYFPIVINEKEYGFDRDTVLETLASHGIFARKYFYPLTSDFSCYNKRFDSSLTPVARYISGRVLTLPLYGNLDIETVDEICRLIESR